jgi:hypothetical protein
VTDEAIQNRHPDGSIETMLLKDLQRIVIETNDTGPWGMDVWWVLEGPPDLPIVRFPQGATGEDKFIEYASTLDGFAIRGMNSTRNARFECWPNPD